MELINIFQDESLISLIPFFSAIYLSFNNPNLRILSLFLALNIIVFYLIVEVLKKRIVKSESQTLEKTFNELINNKNFNYTGLVSILHFIIVLITLWFLYLSSTDFIAYTLFWLLIVCSLFSFVKTAIKHWNGVVKPRFWKK
jgi:small-conductance mechanosensitive channel